MGERGYVPGRMPRLLNGDFAEKALQVSISALRAVREFLRCKEVAMSTAGVVISAIGILIALAIADSVERRARAERSEREVGRNN
jgi:hypothetical protein